MSIERRGGVSLRSPALPSKRTESAVGGLVREAVSVLMESTPKHIDPDQVHQAIAGVPGVRGVHDLHIWVITTGMEALSAHAVLETAAAADIVLGEIREAERFGIDHVTIQFEAEECGACSVRR